MDHALTRQQASAAVDDLGWRLLLGSLRASVVVGSLAQAADAAVRMVAACADHADAHLRLDVRADRVVATLQSPEQAWVTGRDVDCARRISAALGQAGLRATPEVATEGARSVQLLEIAVDCTDAASVRPFWKAVLGYADEPQAAGPDAPLVDPVGQGPAVWFQQMDPPRTQRNRIHVDVSVPHDEAPGRVEAALASGGRLVSAAHAPAFWVLADVEGNEVCVTTWQGREG